MKTIILLLASIAAWGVTASPTAITVYARKWGAYSMYGSRPPAETTITISGTGSWSMARGGSLSTMCGNAWGYCFNAVTSASGNDCHGTLPSGTGAGTVILCWKGMFTDEPPVGTSTGTLTIGSTVIAITLIVQPAVAYVSWPYLSASYPSGCSTPGGYDTAATCTITNERPTSSSFSIPAVAGTYVDPQFGSTVRRVTASGQTIEYGALSAFSATGKYVLTGDQSGNVNAYTVATGSATYTSIPGVSLDVAAWDPVDDEKLWFMSGASIKYRQLNTSTTTTAATYAFNLTMGGTVDITDDGWWAFRDSSSFSGQICAVNLNGLTTSNQSSQTYCASMAAYSFSDVDFTQITQRDSETGKRYVIAVAAPSAQVWSVGASSLTYEYAIPTGNSGDVTAEPHSDVGQDDMGRQFFFWSWYDPFGSNYYMATVQLNKGADMTRPVEEGGGLRILSKSSPGNFTTDGHFGCTWRGVCVHGPYGNSGGISAKQIQSLTLANPCQINSTGHGYTTGNSIQIGGAAGTGATAINGMWTATVLNANAYTVPVSCVGATYTANSGNSALNSATATDSPFRQELIVSRIGHEARRIAVHRAKIYDNGANLIGYYATPRASISRDGSMVAFASNMGVPEQSSVYVAYTGVTTAQALVANVTPADTKAVINYTFPTGFTLTAATITISTAPSLASPVVSASDSLTAPGRQYVATGLTAGTQYFYRIAATNFAVNGQFTTLPTLSGTGAVRIAKGGGGTVNYGTTAGSLSSSCSSPCSLTPSKGLLYTDVTGVASAMLVR